MIERLSVRASDLLYRTRGRDWDYAFLLQPLPIVSEGWYRLHRRIFTHVEPAEKPVLLRGSLGVGMGHAFLATTFTDPRRRDSQGRAIAHYMTWLGAEATTASDVSFGPELLSALDPALDAVFELSPTSLTRGTTQPFDALLRERFAAALATATFSLPVGTELFARRLGTLPL
jgi:hypothetical protein